jgi:hypothetical protein
MSFFASDKDLRKAVPKAVPKPKNSSQILKNSSVTQTFSSKPCTPAPLVADENEKIASKLSSFTKFFNIIMLKF